MTVFIQRIIFFFVPALIAGVVVSLLVVLILLLLVGGVLAVVVKVRREKRAKETVQSETEVEDRLCETVDTTSNVGTCQNALAQPTPPSRHNENTYDYAAATDIFINPASATVSFSANYNVYDSTSGEGHCEDARVEEKLPIGGCYDDLSSKVGKQKKSSLKKNSPKVENPEDLYAQPAKVKKKWKSKKDSQVNTTEEVAVPCDDLYAKPDMTKKKDKRSQQHWEHENEERKPVPTAPLPYKKHVEVMQKADEDEEDIPEVPPPFVPDGEQYYNTKSGAEPPTLDGNYDYAVVDRQHK